jgi:hypothetical protein
MEWHICEIAKNKAFQREAQLIAPKATYLVITFQKSDDISGNKTWASESVKDINLERFFDICR